MACHHLGVCGTDNFVKAAFDLALTLLWTRTTAQEFILGSHFGFVGSCVNVWLRFGKRMLLEVLRKKDEAKIKVPSPDEVEECKITEFGCMGENATCLLSPCLCQHDAS